MYSFTDLHHVLMQEICALPWIKTDHHSNSVLESKYLVHSDIKVTLTLQDIQSSKAEVKSKFDGTA